MVKRGGSRIALRSQVHLRSEQTVVDAELLECSDNKAESYQSQCAGKAADDPFAVNAVGESRGYLRADDGADGKRDHAAKPVLKQARGNMCHAARERGDRQNKQRSRGGDMNWEAQQINQGRHVEKPAADPEEAGDKTEHCAYTRAGHQGDPFKFRRLFVSLPA